MISSHFYLPLHHPLLLYLLDSKFDYLKGTAVHVAHFNVFSELIYFFTLPSKSIISLAFFLNKESCKSPSFNPLIKDYTVSIMERSIISNASRLNLDMYSLKDSPFFYFTSIRLNVVFFSFLLLVICVMNCYAKSVKELTKFGLSVKCQFQAAFLNVKGKDIYNLIKGTKKNYMWFEGLDMIN